jgi:putative chitinase
MTPLTLQLATSSSLADATRYAKPLTECMARWEINNPNRIAAFLANVTVETWGLEAGQMRGLAAVEESLYYSTADRLREIFPSLFVKARGGRYVAEQFTRNHAALSRLRYEGFHGRGLLHLTWRENYAEAGKALGFDYVGKPALVMEPWHACATACWFWADHKQLNEPADALELFAIRKAINGPAALKLVEVKRQRIVAIAAMRDPGTAQA